MSNYELVERMRDFRLRMNLSQPAFCDRYGLSLDTLKSWEKRQRQPETVAALYIEMIMLEPEEVARLVSRIEYHRSRRQKESLRKAAQEQEVTSA